MTLRPIILCTHNNKILLDILKGYRMTTMDDIFKLLKDYRKLPGYQLERRVDIFFAFYLREIFPEILNDKFKDSRYHNIDIDEIIPEFRVYGIKNDNQDFIQVDYAIFCNHTHNLDKKKYSW
jgi:hypothetical protein